MDEMTYEEWISSLTEEEFRAWQDELEYERIAMAEHERDAPPDLGDSYVDEQAGEYLKAYPHYTSLQPGDPDGGWRTEQYIEYRNAYPGRQQRCPVCHRLKGHCRCLPPHDFDLSA